MTSADSRLPILRRLDEIKRKLDRILEELQTPTELARTSAPLHMPAAPRLAPARQVNISSGGFTSTWPEWAFGVAEGALHFNKKVWGIYNNQPFGKQPAA